MDRPHLYLITPPEPDPDWFGPALEEALAVSAGQVAAVLIATGSGESVSLRAAQALVPLVQAHGAAALVLNDTLVAGQAGADGVHMESGPGDLAAAVAALHPGGIVGAGNLKSRHAAMEAAERDPDYVFFGRQDGDTHPQPHPRLLDLANWWSELMTIPVVAMAGYSQEGIAAATSSGAEFVAVGRFVWTHADGPATAVRACLDVLNAPAPGRRETAEVPA